MSIVVMGAVFVDIKGYPQEQYNPAGRNVGRVIHTHGGVSRNVAEDIANVELRPTFVSVVDESGVSRDVVEKLQKHKVNTDYIVTAPDSLGTWLAVFDNTGDVVASISQRPDLTALEGLLEEKGDELVAGASSLVMEIDMEPHLLRRVFDLADRYGKKIYAVVSNMSIAMKRRDLLHRCACVICNQQEAGMLFSEDYMQTSAAEMQVRLADLVQRARIPSMVVTMGAEGAVWAILDGENGYCPALKVDVVDTTGAGDAFLAGVAIGLTYGKTLSDACVIGTRLAASVLATKESVCPRFRPEEFDLDVPEV